jgi:hypothetical protein
MNSAGRIDEEAVGMEFFDNASGKRMKYVYPDSKHWTAGWILYKHPDGQWVTLRKATDADIERISQAVIEAHHAD